MLFDLRGRGRQRTVKVIYLLLAVLMGGGLVLFGIGGNTSGGLVDAITGNGSSSSSSTGAKQYRADAAAAQKAIAADKTDEDAWLKLIRARSNLARTTDGYESDTQTFDAEGKKDLQSALQAWDQYQAIKPKDENVLAQAANLSIRAAIGVGDEQRIVDSAEVLAETKNTAQAYAQLADYAYRLGQTRKGELAGQKAVSLAPAAQKAQVKASIQQSKAAAPTPTPTVAAPTATATAKPKK